MFSDPDGLDAQISIGYTKAAGYPIHHQYHTFTLIADTETDQQFITRAGPSANTGGASGSALSASLAGGSVSGAAGNGGSGGLGLGYLQADTALYSKHLKDNPSTTLFIQPVGVVNADFSDVVNAAYSFEQITNQNEITYAPLDGGVSGYNSNSYTGTFIQSLGFERPSPMLSTPGFQSGRPSHQLSYSQFSVTKSAVK